MEAGGRPGGLCGCAHARAHAPCVRGSKALVRVVDLGSTTRRAAPAPVVHRRGALRVWAATAGRAVCRPCGCVLNGLVKAEEEWRGVPKEGNGKGLMEVGRNLFIGTKRRGRGGGDRGAGGGGGQQGSSCTVLRMFFTSKNGAAVAGGISPLPASTQHCQATAARGEH